jgi:hypothetical protein
LTPTAAGEGAVYVGGQAAFNNPAITGFPSSPWSHTSVLFGGSNPYLDVAVNPSPASGSALTTSWTMGSSQPSFSAGVIVKAASAPVNTGAMFAVL